MRSASPSSADAAWPVHRLSRGCPGLRRSRSLNHKSNACWGPHDIHHRASTHLRPSRRSTKSELPVAQVDHAVCCRAAQGKEKTEEDAMTFPDTYRLPERQRDAMMMLGNAVPPMAAKRVIRALEVAA